MANLPVPGTVASMLTLGALCFGYWSIPVNLSAHLLASMLVYQAGRNMNLPSVDARLESSGQLALNTLIRFIESFDAIRWLPSLPDGYQERLTIEHLFKRDDVWSVVLWRALPIP